MSKKTVIAQNTQLDNDSWETYDWDNGSQSWRVIFQKLNSQKQLYYKEVTFDNDRKVIQEWTPSFQAPSHTWHYTEKDKSGQVVWEWVEDANGNRSYIVGDATGSIDDPKTPEHPDPWDEATVAASGPSLRSEAPHPRPEFQSTLKSEKFIASPSKDTFALREKFGSDTISRLHSDGKGADGIEFRKSIFPEFRAVMNAPIQKGDDVISFAESFGSVALKKLVLANLNADDFRFVA